MEWFSPGLIESAAFDRLPDFFGEIFGVTKGWRQSNENNRRNPALAYHPDTVHKRRKNNNAPLTAYGPAAVGANDFSGDGGSVFAEQEQRDLCNVIGADQVAIKRLLIFNEA